MNSDPIEAQSGSESVNAQSDEKNESSPLKKDHAKPRRRKRAGKRKQKRENESPEEPAPAALQSLAAEERGDSSSPWSPSSDVELDYDGYILRPINFPKAPENSTQFIIDDHNECHLYMSFETDHPHLSHPPILSSDIKEPAGGDAAFNDIDYEYDPPQDFDNTAYNDREFEQSYQNNRLEELLRLSRTELITGIRRLEARLHEITDCTDKENPSPTLEKLQVELVNLQEKNIELKATNVNLTAAMSERGLLRNSVCSELDSPTIDQPLLHNYEEIDAAHSQDDPDNELCFQKSISDSSCREEEMIVEYCDTTVESSICSTLNNSEQISHLHLLDSSNNSAVHNDSSILNDLMCKDSVKLDEVPHSTVPEEHELGAVAV